jgi:protoheme IX farnesyltransferase
MQPQSISLSNQNADVWQPPARRDWRALLTFSTFLVLVSSLTFLAVLGGYLVRFTPDGAICPDWPTCYGQWSLPLETAARIEMGHRVLAAVGALLTTAAAAWAVRQRYSLLVRLSLAASALTVLAQAALGRTLVGAETAWIGGAHLALALSTLAGLIVSTLAVFFEKSKTTHMTSSLMTTPFSRRVAAAVVLTFVLMLSGAWVTDLNAGAACQGWPLCAGGLQSGLAWLAFAHRVLTLLAAVALTSVFVRAWRSQYERPLHLAAATAMGVLFAGQVLIGALKVTRTASIELAGLHAALTAALWSALVLLAAVTWLQPGSLAEEQAALRRERPQGRARLGAFIALNKPIIVALLLVTTYAGMVVGGERIPGLALTFWTMLGGALAAGGASALNQYIDRSIDGSMQRTATRPLPSGRLTPAEGLAYGIGACLAAFFLLAGFVNLLAAVLSVAGMIYYVVLYSILLKYTTTQNIVIGGGAGAIPPLVGWAAATGSLNIPSIFLFALVFMWTPPHFWALALVRRKDYARAGVPMLPVVEGEAQTRLQIFIYTLEMVALTLLMPLFGVGGGVYLVSAGLLGLWIAYSAWRVLRKPGNKVAWQMYRYSSMYLAFIFLALVVDVLV